MIIQIHIDRIMSSGIIGWIEERITTFSDIVLVQSRARWKYTCGDPHCYYRHLIPQTYLR